jgi:hypothetical protein
MKSSPRQLHIDALKMLAAQLIVWHHLCVYGPLPDALALGVPDLVKWIYDYANMAVQVFLVISGYLAAASLAPHSRIWQRPTLAIMARRYRRLVLPCIVALLLSILSAALARQWLGDDFVPAQPTLVQVLSHLLLLQGILNQDALSAGVWYVAIDFQLFILMTLLMWLGQRRHRSGGHPPAWGPGVAQTLVLGLMLASLFVFNRDERWDNWAVYFFGAYGLGAAAYWSGSARRPTLYLVTLVVVGLLALSLEFRGRIAVALTVSLLLGLWRHPAWPVHLLTQQWPDRVQATVMYLGRVSYALFLMHFPILMLGNALFVAAGWISPLAAACTMVGCWALTLILATALERWVEQPLARLG